MLHGSSEEQIPLFLPQAFPTHQGRQFERMEKWTVGPRGKSLVCRLCKVIGVSHSQQEAPLGTMVGANSIEMVVADNLPDGQPDPIGLPGIPSYNQLHPGA